MPTSLRSRSARLATCAVTTASLLLLAGCDKPFPTVTVQSGSSEDHVDAVCWKRDGTPISPTTCQSQLDPDQRAARMGLVKVHAGDSIGVSVDPDVADAGWQVQVGDGALSARRLTDTYFRFGPFGERDLANAPLQLRIFAYAGPGNDARGLWLFTLVRD